MPQLKIDGVSDIVPKTNRFTII